MNKLNHNNLFNYLYNLKNEEMVELETAKFYDKQSHYCYWRFHLINNNVLTIKQQFHYHESQTSYLSFLKEVNLYNFLNNYINLDDIFYYFPTIIDFNSIHLITIYNYPASYTPLENFYENYPNFPEIIPQTVGEHIAKIHYKTSLFEECFNFMNKCKSSSTVPYPAYLLDRFEIDLFSKFSAETLNFIAFYQRYDSLKSAVKELITNHRCFALTHNNLKLNKILVYRNTFSKLNEENPIAIKLIDWENSSWGDPAFDVGTILSGYLQIWLNSLIINPAINLEESLKLATIPLEVLQPSLRIFLKAYLKEYPRILQDYPDFLQRVIQFSGLAIIYEIIAKIESRHVFNSKDICRLQVAKNLLCKPNQSFRAIIGINTEDIVNY